MSTVPTGASSPFAPRKNAHFAERKATVIDLSSLTPRLSYTAIRYPLAAAAVAAMGGLRAQSLQEAWASRVDQALGGDRTESLGRAARLRLAAKAEIMNGGAS